MDALGFVISSFRILEFAVRNPQHVSICSVGNDGTFDFGVRLHQFRFFLWRPVIKLIRTKFLYLYPICDFGLVISSTNTFKCTPSDNDQPLVYYISKQWKNKGNEFRSQFPLWFSRFTITILQPFAFGMHPGGQAVGRNWLSSWVIKSITIVGSN